MSVERIIGVDFGTSTSVIRVKRYEDGEPVEEKLFTKPVVFNMGSSVVPTLIRQTNGDVVYGYQAEIQRKNSDLYQSFKVLLESDDPEQKANARKLTEDFLAYLASVYREQSDGGHLGDASDTEKTVISYPVKWSEETKAFMIEAAKNAGFPSVTGQDEASAAIRATTLQNEALLERKGYLKVGKALNVLLLDMGAGTTDLVLCRYMPGFQNEILCTYPKDGNILFGGREIDALLGQYIAERVPAEFQQTVMKKIGLEKYKAWKDLVVSHDLQNCNTVESFGALDELADHLGFDVEYSVDRAVLETLLHDYLQGLPRLIAGCLQEADMSGEDIDLVILTGGHSQWYFVKDILTGKNKAFGDCGLKKAEADNDRVISIALPQETVALGLAFSGLVSESKPIPVSDPDPVPDPDPDPVPGPLGGVVVAGDAEWIGKKEDEKDGEKGLPFLMPIEKVINKPDKGVVVTGVIERGTVRVGDRIQIAGMSPTWSDLCGCGVVNEIEMSHKGIDCATAGDSVGLLLSQEIVANEVERSMFFSDMVVCEPDSIRAFYRFLGCLALDDVSLSSFSLLHFRFRTKVIPGIIEEWLPDSKHFLCRLPRSVPMEEGLSFEILREGKYICSGTVTDPIDQSEGATPAALQAALSEYYLNSETTDIDAAESFLKDLTGLEEELEHSLEKVKKEGLDYSKTTRDKTKKFFRRKYYQICEKWPDRFQKENNSFIGNTIGQMEFPGQSTIERKGGIKGVAKGAAKGAGVGAAAGAAVGSIVPGIGTAMGALVGGFIGAFCGPDGSQSVDDSVATTMSYVENNVLPALLAAFRTEIDKAE